MASNFLSSFIFARRPMVSIVNRLKKAGVDWQYLTDSSEQVVLFGSRAAGYANRKSDWDLLIISNEDIEKPQGPFDFIVITPERSQSEEWLGSELAVHVAKYGKWLHGEDTWSYKVVSYSKKAIQEKRRKIEKNWKMLTIGFDRLVPQILRRRVEMLRRDMQRLELMQKGIPVPPNAVLDSQWKSASNRAGRFSELWNVAFQGIGEPDLCKKTLVYA